MMLHRHFESNKVEEKPATDMCIKEGHDILVAEPKETEKPKRTRKRKAEN